MKSLMNIESSGLFEQRRSISDTPTRAGKKQTKAMAHLPSENQSAKALSALQEAFRIAGPALFDLMVELIVIVPEEWVLEVIHDLDDQGCVCRSSSIENGYYIITAALPLRQSFGYHERLKILSQGTGTFSMRLSGKVKTPSSRYPKITPACGL